MLGLTGSGLPLGFWGLPGSGLTPGFKESVGMLGLTGSGLPLGFWGCTGSGLPVGLLGFLFSSGLIFIFSTLILS